MNKKKITILSIEDNIADFDILQNALKKIDNINISMINVDDGEKAMRFLHKNENYKNAPTPDIILLDLNLPTLNGKEVLKLIKENRDLKHIPVIILTSSSLKTDIHESYLNHANSYITKSFDIHELTKKLVSMGKYWFSINELTKKDTIYNIEN